MSLRIPLVPILVTLAWPAAARAGDVSVTDVQLLHGAGFDDRAYGNATRDGRMTTLTLEHFGTWDYGDNFFFVDVRSGDFVEPGGVPAGQTVKIYAEWGPRLSLGKLLGRKQLTGALRDVSLAAQVNRDGDGFWANLLGAGVDVALPGRLVLGVNAYVRDDKFNAPTFQVSPFWDLPFALGRVALVFRGYVDLAGADDGWDLGTQPQLLVDVGKWLGAPGRVRAGGEWYLHRASDGAATSALQGVVQWTW